MEELHRLCETSLMQDVLYNRRASQPAFAMATPGFSVTTASCFDPAVDGILIEGPAGQKDHREASVSSKGIVGNMCLQRRLGFWRARCCVANEKMQIERRGEAEPAV
jgi:hypothetical protein